VKILLANPPCKISIDSMWERYFVRAGSRWPYSTIKKKTESPFNLPFPFFLAYAAALLSQDGFKVESIDGVALDCSIDEFLKRICKVMPDLIVLETATPTFDYDLLLVKKIKKGIPEAKILVVGPHASFFAKELLQSYPEVDYAIRGEYEIALQQFCRQFRAGKNLADILGLVYRSGGEVIVNEYAPLIDPLDKLPYPAWDFFPTRSSPNMTIYWDALCQYKPSVQMHSSRGCPYRCYFCLWNQVMYRCGKYRTFSPSRVVNEMSKVISKFGAKEIYFDDDDFTVSRKHVQGICAEIKRRNLNVRWSCMGSPSHLNEQMIRDMATAGCVGIKVGVESGNNKILRTLGKPVDLNYTKKVVEWCVKYGIKVHATFTFGLLGETKESMEETLDYACRLDTDSVQFSVTVPFPGTKFYEELEKRNQLNVTNWLDFDGNYKCVLNYEHLSVRQLTKFQSRAYGKWLLHKLCSPKWLLQHRRTFIRSLLGLGISGFYVFFMRVLKYRIFNLGNPACKPME